MSQSDFKRLVEDYKGVLTEEEVKEHVEELAYLK